MKFFLCGATFFLGLFALTCFGLNPNEFETSLEPTSESEAMAHPTMKPPGVVKSVYGETSAGQQVHKFVCENSHGMVMEMISYGAIMTSLYVPDRDGNKANVTLTCDDIAAYEACQSYFGGTVGRYCNRIRDGKFSIGENEYNLAKNNAPNHLHGGDVGFDKVIWEAEPIETEDSAGVRFTYVSKDGEEGYPGTLKVIAEYSINNQNELIIDLKAETDKTTHVNLTNHNYWNLAGTGDIKDHLLKIESDKYLPADATLIPTGELKDVADTLFDYREFRQMGDRLDQVGDDPRGFDLCYGLRNQDGSLKLAAVVKEESSGRLMEIWTTQPGLQYYTGNFLDGSAGSGGYGQYNGFCLETQHYPDSPNQAHFPSTQLKPGEQFRQTTVHKFKTF